MLDRAERVIPLGAQTFSKSKIQLPPGAAPLFVTHGDGGRVFDVDGNEYVDLISALMPNVLGYRDPDVDLAIRRQLTRGISFSLPTELESQLAERLVAHVPCAEMVRFGKNGTDATSAAIRLARAATRRDRIMLCGYHGWQDWYIGATSRNLGVPAAVSALSHPVPYGDIAAVEALFAKYPASFAALIVEPAGATEPAPGYLQELKDLVHRHGAILIFDEIITGFRWSIGGAQSYYGVAPDLACFGKAMGNGMPISADRRPRRDHADNGGHFLFRNFWRRNSVFSGIDCDNRQDRARKSHLSGCGKLAVTSKGWSMKKLPPPDWMTSLRSRERRRGRSSLTKTIHTGRRKPSKPCSCAR